MANKPKTPAEEAAWLAEMTARAVASGAVVAPALPTEMHRVPPNDLASPLPKGEMPGKASVVIGTQDPNEKAAKEARWQEKLAQHRTPQPAPKHLPTASDSLPEATQAVDAPETRPEALFYERTAVLAAINARLGEKMKDRKNQTEAYSHVGDYRLLIDATLATIPQPSAGRSCPLKQPFGLEQMAIFRAKVRESAQYNTRASTGLSVLVAAIDAVAAETWGVRLDSYQLPAAKNHSMRR